MKLGDGVKIQVALQGILESIRVDNTFVNPVSVVNQPCVFACGDPKPLANYPDIGQAVCDQKVVQADGIVVYPAL